MIDLIFVHKVKCSFHKGLPTCRCAWFNHKISQVWENVLSKYVLYVKNPLSLLFKMVRIIKFIQNLIILESSHYKGHKPLCVGDLLEPMTCAFFFQWRRTYKFFLPSSAALIWWLLIQENMETPIPLVCNGYHY